MSFSKFRTMTHCLMLRRFSLNDYWITRTRQSVWIDLWSETLDIWQLSETAGTKTRTIKRCDRKVWKRYIWYLHWAILIVKRYLHISSWSKTRSKRNTVFPLLDLDMRRLKTTLHLENSDNWKNRKVSVFSGIRSFWANERLFSRSYIHKFIFT